jgi:broad specificity phosphatase PhoE
MIQDNEFILSLIRHGESEVNATPDIMGQTAHVKLTEKGKEQARRLGLRLLKRGERFDYVYASSYDRALETARLACDNNQEIIVVPDIREYDAGDWTGASRSSTMTDAVKAKMNYMNQAFLPPNGESFTMVERRASAWVENEILYNPKMIEQANYRKVNKLPMLNIGCFSHGMTIKCLLQYVTGFDRGFTWKVQIDNTSVTRLYFGPEGWRLLNVNDCFHLEV